MRWTSNERWKRRVSLGGLIVETREERVKPVARFWQVVRRAVIVVDRSSPEDLAVRLDG